MGWEVPPDHERRVHHFFRNAYRYSLGKGNTPTAALASKRCKFRQGTLGSGSELRLRQNRVFLNHWHRPQD